MFELNFGQTAPFALNYRLQITNKDQLYIAEVLDDVSLTRESDGVPAKLTFSVVNDSVLDFTEGNTVDFYVNDVNVFHGYVFEKERDKKNIIKVLAYDQLRYFKNKDVYVYKNKTADEVLKMVCEDYKLTTGTIVPTQYKIPSRIEKDKTLIDVVNMALYLTEIQSHKMYWLYDDAGKICLSDDESMKQDIMIDADTMENFTVKSSIDKETYNYIKVVRNVPDGANRKLVRTGVIADKDHVIEWGRLQQVYLPDDKVENAIDLAIAKLKNSNKKSREIRLKSVLGDVRIRAGSKVYLKHNFCDLNIDSYVTVKSVTHKFSHGIHLMDIDVLWIEPTGDYTIEYNGDAEAIAKIKSAEKNKSNDYQTIGGARVSSAGQAQVDEAFRLSDGRVSPYGSQGCADTACYAGSFYNKDLAEEYRAGTADCDTLESHLAAKGYQVESFNGYANKGDLLLYGNNDHVVIADGAGGCFGNSSSRGYALHYNDANYAWGNGESPTKIIRMGVR